MWKTPRQSRLDSGLDLFIFQGQSSRNDLDDFPVSLGSGTAKVSVSPYLTESGYQVVLRKSIAAQSFSFILEIIKDNLTDLCGN